jgi:hypothetical protein
VNPFFVVLSFVVIIFFIFRKNNSEFQKSLLSVPVVLGFVGFVFLVAYGLLWGKTKELSRGHLLSQPTFVTPEENGISDTDPEIPPREIPPAKNIEELLIGQLTTLEENETPDTDSDPETRQGRRFLLNPEKD